MAASSSTDRLRIVLLGYIVRGPIGGMTWHHLQYALGLRALGHEVLFLEDSDDYPSCYDPSRHLVGSDPTYGLAYADNVFSRFDASDSWAYYDAHCDSWHGPAAHDAIGFCKEADLLINVSGVNPLRSWTASILRRAFVDTDPVFTQVAHLTDECKLRRAAAHNLFFSFGENIGQLQSRVPQDGFAWQPTRQPLFLDAWEMTKSPRGAPLTTVMQWDSYPAAEYQRQRYGLKSRSFAEFGDLPHMHAAAFEIALGGHAAPREELKTQGWRITNPLEITPDPWTYQQYIRESKAEFSVAKHGYVVSRCGWFSERSACYLASGRPVITQETGFSDQLPTGRGLWAFSDVPSALAALDALNSGYDGHCQAARDIAEACFASAHVLSSLVDRAMNGVLLDRPVSEERQ
jgi:hypothetical protein